MFKECSKYMFTKARRFSIVSNQHNAVNSSEITINTIPNIRLPRLHQMFEKWLVFSDLHVRNQTIETCVEVLKNIHKIAIENKHGVIFLGDFWHIRGSLNVELVNTILNEFKQWDRGIPLIMIPGNHDQVHLDGLTNSLEILKYAFADNQVLIINKPSLCLGALWIPYRRDKALVKRLIEGLVYNKNYFHYNMVFCHAEFRGMRSSDVAIVQEQGYAKEDINSNRGLQHSNSILEPFCQIANPSNPIIYAPEAMNITAIRSTTSRVVLRKNPNDVVVYSGHYHNPHVLQMPIAPPSIQKGTGVGEAQEDSTNTTKRQKEVYIRYVGSPYQISLAEANQQKYVYTINRREDWRSNTYPKYWAEGEELLFDITSSKKFYQCNGDDDQELARIRQLVKKNDRVVIHVPSDYYYYQDGNATTANTPTTTGVDHVSEWICDLQSMGAEVVTRRKTIKSTNWTPHTRTNHPNSLSNIPNIPTPISTLDAHVAIPVIDQTISPMATDTDRLYVSPTNHCDIYTRYLNAHELYKQHPLKRDLLQKGIEYIDKHVSAQTGMTGTGHLTTEADESRHSHQGYHELQLDSVGISNFGPFGTPTQGQGMNQSRKNYPVSGVIMDVNGDSSYLQGVDVDADNNTKTAIGTVVTEGVQTRTSASMLNYPLSNRGLVLIRGDSNGNSCSQLDDGNIGVSGNGVGKTSLLMSVMWALSGSLDAKLAPSSDTRMNDVVYDYATYACGTGTTGTVAVAEVCVRGLINKIPFEVLRKRNATSKKTELFFQIDGVDLTCLSVKDTQSLIDMRLGIRNNLLSRCVFFGQHSHSVNSLLGSTDVCFKQELVPLLESMHIEQWIQLANRLRVDLKVLKQEISELEVSSRLYGEELQRLELDFDLYRPLDGEKVHVQRCDEHTDINTSINASASLTPVAPVTPVYAEEDYQSWLTQREALTLQLKTYQMRLTSFLQEKQTQISAHDETIREWNSKINKRLLEKGQYEMELGIKRKGYKCLVANLLDNCSSKGKSEVNVDIDIDIDSRCIIEYSKSTNSLKQFYAHSNRFKFKLHEESGIGIPISPLLHDDDQLILNIVELYDTIQRLCNDICNMNQGDKGLIPRELVKQIGMPQPNPRVCDQKTTWKDWNDVFIQLSQRADTENPTFETFREVCGFMNVNVPDSVRSNLEAISSVQSQLNVKINDIAEALAHIQSHVDMDVLSLGSSLAGEKLDIEMIPECPTCGQPLNESSVMERMTDLNRKYTRFKSQLKHLEQYHTLWRDYYTSVEVLISKYHSVFDYYIFYMEYYSMMEESNRYCVGLELQLKELGVELEKSMEKKHEDLLDLQLKENHFKYKITECEDHLTSIRALENKYVNHLRFEMEQNEENIKKQIEKERTRVLNDAYSNKLKEYQINKNRLKHILESNTQKIQENKVLYNIYNEILSICGPKGIQNYLYCNVIDELQYCTNRYLDILSNETIQIEFQTDRNDGHDDRFLSTTAPLTSAVTSINSDKISKSVYIKSNPSGSDNNHNIMKQRSISQLSGGQWKRVSLALDLAYADILRREGKLSVNIMVFDEMFTFLDAAGHEAVSQLLCSMMKNRPNRTAGTDSVGTSLSHSSLDSLNNYAIGSKSQFDSIFIILQNHYSDSFEEMFDAIDVVYKK